MATAWSAVKASSSPAWTSSAIRAGSSTRRTETPIRLIEAATDRPVLRLPFEHAGEQWTCYCEVREAQHRVVFYTVPAVTVPASSMAIS